VSCVKTVPLNRDPGDTVLALESMKGERNESQISDL